MQKENNCCCPVCQVERSLLNSLSTQTARTHFQALACNYPILNHFDSPADVIAQLRERAELVNHQAWNGILHALVGSIANGTGEEIGQQLLLVAYSRERRHAAEWHPWLTLSGDNLDGLA